MKLCLLTYNMARHWELAELIKVARLGGFSGLELRAEAGHKHGVELETSAEERRAIRYQVQDACLEVAGISTSSRFDTPDATKRREVVERSKRYIELAADVNAGQIRVFGNDMPKEGVDGGAPPAREDVMRYVGDSLRELGEFAEPHGVNVMLEMHGQFNYWHFAMTAVEHADHPQVSILYNCDNRDLVGGSVASTYNRVAHLIGHVHMHDFVNGFPYAELFGLLQRDGYDGYLSSEIGKTDPSHEDYFLMYAQLFRAWNALAAAAGESALPYYAAAAGTVATAGD